MDKRELRLAIKAKLDHRRKLLAENSRLHSEVDRYRSALGSVAFNITLENAADEIVREILTAAINAADVIADQTVDHGDYVVGIDIPSLHIRRRISRFDVMDMGAMEGSIDERPVRHISIPMKYRANN